MNNRCTHNYPCTMLLLILCDFNAMQMARVCWWFYFSKVIELTDTVFFILRKKNNQLTFLHVYHHGTMIFNWWAGVKYVAGGQSFLIGLINSFVHVVMYMYYGRAALGPQMHKYLQFFIVTIHSAVNLYADCDFPDSMNIIMLGYAFSLIALFSSFYYQNYISKKTKMVLNLYLFKILNVTSKRYYIYTVGQKSI
uniref:Elongation of very long chain fatty acids protein n=1 Tax=Sinocyclocheilus grahami TaxID=75366 RepID=A0A672RH69_SINGR